MALGLDHLIFGTVDPPNDHGGQALLSAHGILGSNPGPKDPEADAKASKPGDQPVQVLPSATVLNQSEPLSGHSVATR